MMGLKDEKYTTRTTSDQNASGYYTCLGIKFTSTYQQIERNYNELLKYYIDTNNSFQKNKVQEAYYYVKNEHPKKEYLHNLIIRSYLSQPHELSLQSRKDTNKLFPFFVFEVYKDTDDETHIFFYNFVTQTLTESIKENLIKSWVFSNISAALYSKKDNEFIINFIENGKLVNAPYRAKFQSQRDLIVKLTIFAKEIFEETKPTLEFHNPNTKQDMTLFKIQHFSIGENSKNVSTKIPNHFLDCSTRNYFLWNDSVIPHASIFKGSALKIKKFGKSSINYFIVGKCQMLLSRDEEVKKIIQVVPLRKDNITVNREEQMVEIIVLNKIRKYKFNDKQLASAFVHVTISIYLVYKSLMMILNQKVNLQNVVLQLPQNESASNLLANKKQQYQQINTRIQQLEAQLSEFKLKKQQILLDMNDDDLNDEKNNKDNEEELEQILKQDEDQNENQVLL